MDTLRGFIYLETSSSRIDRKETWCLAVENPKNSMESIIIKCRAKKIYGSDYYEKTSSNKRGGHWKFKAFRFNGNIDKIEASEKPIIKIIPNLPESFYKQIPLSELRKLKEWTD
jgi:hypothetical protein